MSRPSIKLQQLPLNQEQASLKLHCNVLLRLYHVDDDGKQIQVDVPQALYERLRDKILRHIDTVQPEVIFRRAPDGTWRLG
jgi:hypothetical protein